MYRKFIQINRKQDNKKINMKTDNLTSEKNRKYDNALIKKYNIDLQKLKIKKNN